MRYVVIQFSLLFVIIFFFYLSCQPDVVREYSYDLSVHKIGFCDSIYSTSSSEFAYQLNLAKCEYLNLNDKVCLEILQENAHQLNGLSTSDSLYRRYYLTKFKCIQNNVDNKYLIEIDSVLDVVLMHEGENSFYIHLLHIKSNILRDLLHTNYSFTSSLYALYLEQKISSSETIVPSGNYFHAIGLMREYIDTTGRELIFLKKALEFTPKEMPLRRKIECLYRSRINPNDDFSDLLEHNQYSPRIDKFITTHASFLGLNSNEDNSNLLNEPCENFFKLLYAIQDLLKDEDLDKAILYIDLLSQCEFENGIMNSLVSVERLKYFEKILGEHTDIENLTISKELGSKLKNVYNVDKGNLHYADISFEINDVLFKLMNQSINRNTGVYSRDELISNLIDAKLFTKNLGVIELDKSAKDFSDEIKKYLELLEKIDSMEQEVDNYKMTDYPDYSIFEDLYKYHSEVYEIEKRITNQRESNHSQQIMEKKDEVNYITQKKDIQILEISQGLSDYFITYINPKTITMNSYSRIYLDSLVSKTLLEIQSKEILNDKTIASILLKDLDEEYDNLIIIPDGKLNELPFDALTFNNSEDKLGKKYYLSSTRSIEDIGDSDVKLPSQGVLYSYSDNNTISDNKPKSIPELKTGMAEVDNISKLYKSATPLKGSQVTEENVHQNLSSPILHFSTHSYSSPNNMLDNYLYVRDEDGEPKKMYGFEIKHKTIPNSLVILSSCNSGTGVYAPGAGTFSLSRDFLQAGAQTVIKSLWAVNEASTKELMVEFHTNLTQGQSAGESLTNAKRTLMEHPKYAHPYYWAGFVLEGNPNVYVER